MVFIIIDERRPERVIMMKDKYQQIHVLDIFMRKLRPGKVRIWILAVLFLGAIWSCGENSAPDKIRFVSLAWQQESVRCIRDLINDWNKTHPELPVQYIQGTWGSVHDYLITAFETGDVPDIFHYESSIIIDFAARGFLEDLTPMIPQDMHQDILEQAWESVTYADNNIYGIPFLMESFIGLYNRRIFEQHRIDIPSSLQPWTWEEMRHAARKMTGTDSSGKQVWGAAMGLRNSANLIMNHAISFGGSFFKKREGRYIVEVDSAEKALLQNINSMLYADKSMAPSSIGKTGTEMIPGFIDGRYAMLIGIGAWARQQVAANAPAGFQWGVIPPLLAANQNTGINTQTLSIPKKAAHKKAAMEFLVFILNRANMAKMAASDWMLPTRNSCLAMPEFSGSRNGWDVVTSGVPFLVAGEWLGAPGYVEWKSRVANPVLQEFYAGRLSLNDAAKRIMQEGNLVLSKYQ